MQSILEDDADGIIYSDRWGNLIWAGKRDIQPLPDFEVHPLDANRIRYPIEESPWIRVGVLTLMPAFYNILRGWDDWEREYRVPPKVVSY